jgi:hypothetical protein
MTSFLRRQSPERVDAAHNTFTIDDHRVDHETILDPETGLLVQRPIKITPEQEHARELAAMHHALESVDYRIATLDPNDVMAYEEPLSDERMERKRAGLDLERLDILDKLAELEAAEPPTGRKLKLKA